MDENSIEALGKKKKKSLPYNFYCGNDAVG